MKWKNLQKVSPLIEEKKSKAKKSTRIFYFANKSGDIDFLPTQFMLRDYWK